MKYLYHLDAVTEKSHSHRDAALEADNRIGSNFSLAAFNTGLPAVRKRPLVTMS